jgi:hypothetical protein
MPALIRSETRDLKRLVRLARVEFIGTTQKSDLVISGAAAIAHAGINLTFNRCKDPGARVDIFVSEYRKFSFTDNMSVIQ